MFYKMIECARDRWYASANCTIQSLIEYMSRQGNLRDAQIDAIKTYLFLKIGCENKPLSIEHHISIIFVCISIFHFDCL